MQKINKSGISLIEVILYMGIVAFVLVALFAYGWNVIGLNMKSQTVKETLVAAQEIGSSLDYEIRRAESVNSGDSIFNNSQSKLALNNTAGEVIFEMSGDAISISRNGGEKISISPKNIKIRDLAFQKEESGSGEVEYVGYSFVLESALNGTSASSEYQYSLDVSSGSSIRNH